MIQNLFSSAGSLGAASQSLFDGVQRVVAPPRVQSAKAAPPSTDVSVTRAASIDTTSLRLSLRATNAGMSMTEAIDGTLSGVSEKLVEMRKLAVVSEAAGTGDAARVDLMDQVAKLRDAILGDAESTMVDGVALTDGTQDGFAVPVDGLDQADVEVATPTLTPAALGLSSLDVTTPSAATDAVSAIDGALRTVSHAREQNRDSHRRLSSAAEAGAARALDAESQANRVDDGDAARASARNLARWVGTQGQQAAAVQARNIQRAVTTNILM